jgi:carbonic anhydrase
MDRRQFLTGSLMAATLWNAPSALADPVSPMSPDQALQVLKQGNQRFVQHKLRHPDESQKRLQEVSHGQHPYAALLSCADSRVPPEILFDAGIGNLFDIRVAGNVVTPEILGSLEYAIAVLGTPLIVVLGHERCGAVTAAVQGGTLPGQIGTFVAAIGPAIVKTKGELKDRVDASVLSNVQYQIGQMTQRSEILQKKVAAGQLKIVGGRYDLDEGRVSWI